MKQKQMEAETTSCKYMFGETTISIHFLCKDLASSDWNNRL